MRDGFDSGPTITQDNSSQNSCVVTVPAAILALVHPVRSGAESGGRVGSAHWSVEDSGYNSNDAVDESGVVHLTVSL